MSSDQKKAEATAVAAAEAMVRTIDFAVDVLRELSKQMSARTFFRMTRTDPVRNGMRDEYVLHRYTAHTGPGESRVTRYLYSPFIVPHDVLKGVGGGRIIPFLAVSLVNSEGRPPSILQVILRDCEGRERNEEAYLEHFAVWLNEGLNAIKEAATEESWGYIIHQTLEARAEVNKLTAKVQFTERPLFGITEDNLAEQAESLSHWMWQALHRADVQLPEQRA